MLYCLADSIGHVVPLPELYIFTRHVSDFGLYDLETVKILISTYLLSTNIIAENA
jgi:hypothetical protein